MKSWAEACSSDDEDSEEEVEVEEVEEVVETTKSEEHHPQPQKEEPSHHHHHPQKEYIFPTEPPFKAYVGNVAFVIKEDEHLANEIKKLCLEQLQTNIKVVKAKLAQDRSTGQMRGFGYVEVETLEMVRFFI
jgi:RNA recognition motif-containing protein